MIPRVYIPTRGRAGNVATLLNFKDLSRFTLVVRKDEAKEYVAHHPGVDILVLPTRCENISQIRQFILDQSGIMFMFDDDLTFRDAQRKPLSHSAAHKMLNDMQKAEAGQAIVGVNASWQISLTRHRPRDNAKILHAWFIRINKLKTKPRFDTFQPMVEDQEFILQAILCKLPVIRLNMYCCSDVRFASGGCTDMGRNDEMHNESSIRFAARWPQVVKTTISKASGLTDVKMYFVKAQKLAEKGLLKPC